MHVLFKSLRKNKKSLKYSGKRKFYFLYFHRHEKSNRVFSLEKVSNKTHSV